MDEGGAQQFADHAQRIAMLAQLKLPRYSGSRAGEAKDAFRTWLTLARRATDGLPVNVQWQLWMTALEGTASQIMEVHLQHLEEAGQVPNFADQAAMAEFYTELFGVRETPVQRLERFTRELQLRNGMTMDDYVALYYKMVAESPTQVPATECRTYFLRGLMQKCPELTTTLEHNVNIGNMLDLIREARRLQPMLQREAHGAHAMAGVAQPQPAAGAAMELVAAAATQRRAGGACYSCGQHGHYKANCPQRGGPGGGARGRSRGRGGGRGGWRGRGGGRAGAFAAEAEEQDPGEEDYAYYRRFYHDIMKLNNKQEQYVSSLNSERDKAEKSQGPDSTQKTARASNNNTQQ